MLYMKQLYILIISHLYIIIVYLNILLWTKYMQMRKFAKQLARKIYHIVIHIISLILILMLLKVTLAQKAI